MLHVNISRVITDIFPFPSVPQKYENNNSANKASLTDKIPLFCERYVPLCDERFHQKHAHHLQGHAVQLVLHLSVVTFYDINNIISNALSKKSIYIALKEKHHPPFLQNIKMALTLSGTELAFLCESFM